MKNIILVLALLSAIAANAQQRILPMVDINQETYREVVKYISIIEHSSYIEKMEGIKTHTNQLTTSGGEILLRKERNSIYVVHVEFSKILEDHIKDQSIYSGSNPNRRWYDFDSIRTELIIQNAKLFEFLSEVLSGNRNVKKMYIKMDPRTGGAYIRVDYYRL